MRTVAVLDAYNIPDGHENVRDTVQVRLSDIHVESYIYVVFMWYLFKILSERMYAPI